MNRADRVLALLDRNLDPDEAFAAGVTLQDADDAVAILRLDIELTRAVHDVAARDMVAEFLRDLSD